MAVETEIQSGVVYVGHLPHGFYEDQLRDYFNQFGKVNKVKVARNKKVITVTIEVMVDGHPTI